MRDTLLNWIAELVWRRPVVVIAVAVVLAAISAVYAALELRLNANPDDLIAPSRPFMADYRRLLNEFGDLEYVYAVVDEPDQQRAQAIVDLLTRRIQSVDGLLGVYGAVQPHEQLRIATRAMPEEALAGLSQASSAFPVLLEADGAADVLRNANAMLRRLVVGGAVMEQTQQQRLGAAAVFLLKLIAAANPESPSREDLAFILGIDRQPEYFKSETGRLHFVTIMPAKDYTTLSMFEQPLREIRAIIDQVQREFPGAEIGLTGKPVLAADEMITSSRDMAIASVIGFVLVSGLFMLFIGGIWRPALAAVAFTLATAWTYGAATLFVGQLNLLSIVFALVLVGIGFDFGVHLLARYNEHRRTESVRDSIRLALRTTGRGNLTSAVTSSAVFFLAIFTSFQGLRELGLIAGLGLLLCLVAMTVVLPALIVLYDRNRTKPAIDALRLLMAEHTPGILRWPTHRPGLVIIALGVITIALLALSDPVRFEENLLKLQAEGTASVEWEHRVLQDSPSASWYGAIIANDLDELQAIEAQAAQYKDTIGNVQSVLDVIQLPTPQREQLRQELHVDAPVASDSDEAARSTLRPEELGAAGQSLDLLSAAAAAAGQSADDIAELRQISSDLKALARQMTAPNAAAEVQARIEANITAAASSVRAMLEGDLMPLRDALPDAVRDMLMASEDHGGRFLVMLFPRQNVWDTGAMKAFIDDLRAIDPHVTGAPIAHYESLQDMKQSFALLAMLAFVAVAVLVWLDFRKLGYVILAMIPLIVGTIWLVETMAVFDVSFNLANFFSVPILLGVGVDGAVHLLHRYSEGGQARLHFGSTRRAVILTALTTMIGFGCLIFAHHRGMRSLGLVMAVGSFAILMASLLLLPALLALLERWGFRLKPRNSVSATADEHG